MEHSAEYTNSTVGLNTPAKSSIVYSELCGIEQLINNGGLNMNHLRMDYLANAILAFAHAFKRLHVELCEGQGQRCHVQFQNEINGDMILRHLSNASFTGIHGEKITFDVHGEPKPRYSLMNYVKDGDSYRWREVGQFNFQEGESQLDLHSEIVFKEHIRRLPKSECSTSCLSGEVRILTKDGDRRCCWSCAPCEVNEFMKDAYTCEKCDVGTKPNVTQSGCVAIEPIYLSYENPWAIVNMIIASCGICATLVVIGIFYLNKNTTIVKASGGTLNFILLFGVLLSYAVTFILVAKPTGFTCAVSRLIPGLCYTFSYAPVFTKTHRISKLFNKRSFGRHSKDITEKWTVFLTCLLIFVQVPIVGIWLHFDPPGTTLQYNDYQTTVLICKGAGDFSYLIGLAYPFVLILFCTLYAIQSRNIPNVFSESRYIAFTMYSTCVIWLAFIPVYMVTLSNIPLRVTSICITLGLDASVTLGMLFGPKAYVILFRQDHNQRDYFLQKTMEFSQKVTAHQMNSKLGKHGSHSSLSFDSVAQNKASTPVHSRN
ncbi:unnamed protein product [Owenia fusiformis]|uniref:G-protein coupled receptors family 3 profile domain-containing protein n=1 Tax=Owenia fusiformis TaxID=6347 RepID=A0A8S4NJG8_OWEFU|nr:unnamed protein product [Owenia fusiformis]